MDTSVPVPTASGGQSARSVSTPIPPRVWSVLQRYDDALSENDNAILMFLPF